MTLTALQKASFRHHTHRKNQIIDEDTGDPIQVGGSGTPAANVPVIATPASATPQDVAETVNDLIAALIAADLMEAS